MPSLLGALFSPLGDSLLEERSWTWWEVWRLGCQPGIPSACHVILAQAVNSNVLGIRWPECRVSCAQQRTLNFLPITARVVTGQLSPYEGRLVCISVPSWWQVGMRPMAEKPVWSLYVWWFMMTRRVSCSDSGARQWSPRISAPFSSELPDMLTPIVQCMEIDSALSLLPGQPCWRGNWDFLKSISVSFF